MRKQTKLVAVLSATALLAVGASMTSFARGWTNLGDGNFVWLDSDGERVTQTWKKHESDYFWLDDEGLMARSQLVDDGTDIYYVTSTGARLKNAWAVVENKDDLEVNGREVEVLYYYFGSNGKAYRSTDTDLKKKTIDWGGSKRTFFFDADGHMASGWVKITEGAKDNVYYCGEETEGFAYTGWQYLEPMEDLVGEQYDDLEYFSFEDSGKMRKGEAEGKPKVWYYNGWYYTFDENGVLMDDWYNISIATNSNGVATANNKDNGAFTTSVGTKGTGWVYTENPEETDSYWYYLVSFKDSNGTVRNIPFNSQSDGRMRAKLIKGKTYLFNSRGEMQKGLQEITTASLPVDDKGGARSKALEPGYYYFSEGGSTVVGQMLTGKQAVPKDGETFYYYFDKATGRAYTDRVKDGILYGHDGKRIQAEDGNTNAVITLDYDIAYDGKNAITWVKDGATFKGIPKGSEVIVTSTGKLVTSTGTVKVDGEKYKMNFSAIDGEGNKIWKAEYQPE